MTTDQGTIEMDARYRAAMEKLRKQLEDASRGEKLTRISHLGWQVSKTLINTDQMTQEDIFALGVGAGINAAGKVILEVLESLA